MAIQKKRSARLSLRGRGQKTSFPIVGVGASAGGFEAFGEMLEALPVDCGLAIVLIQHLDPTHESMLAPLLARKSALPVNQVTNGMAVKPNHVYVIPPNTNMGIHDGRLKLTKRAAAGGKNMPIDHFLQSLAAYRKDRAIGVILSGTATDGTFGLKAIQAEGGICFAQDEQSAKYSGMPASAIAAGCVDFVLPPKTIAVELVRIARQEPPGLLGSHSKTIPTLPAGSDEYLRRVFVLLRNATGADFTHYKSSTVYRRIARRMLLQKVGSIREYFSILRGDPVELSALYHDILINVTSFFREPETFQILKKRMLPQLLAGQNERDGLRVWVPGCSTGEEAYSIAIVLTEYLGDRLGKTPVQIFATDINESSIEQARTGIYTGTTLGEIGPERLAKFFVKSKGSYQIAQTIRDMCTFARQDLTQDPPFSRINLISCRNVLIYLEPILQKKILGAFHYALKEKGYLLLGKSETLSAYPDLFTLVDKKSKYFRKKAASYNPPLVAAAGHDRSAQTNRPHSSAPPPPDLQREADRVVWSRYSHAGVIVDENQQILHFRGNTSPYLAPASGAASLHLLKMIREDLRVDLRAAFHRAKKENSPVRKEGVRMTSGGQATEVCLDVIPLSALDTADRHFLILFEETRTKPFDKKPSRATARVKTEVDPAVRLQHELTATREYLQAIIEEQETTNEELKAANEEVLSNNEELQSTNEELETAKEELHSTNEELVTLTEQQASRNAELNQLNDDLTNVLDGVQIPIVMLGKDLCIRRFTSSAEKVFNLLPTDVGRPIQNLRSNLNLPDMQRLIESTMETATMQEREVRDVNGRYYTMSIRPYRASNHRIDGVLIALADTDAIRNSLDEARRAHNYAHAIVETVREPLVVLDPSFHVVTANLSFYRVFQLSPQETEKQRIFDVADGGWDIPRLRKLLEEILAGNTPFNDFKIIHVFPKVGRRTLLLNARRLLLGETPGMILLAMEDLTDRELTTEALQQSRERLRDLTAGLLTAQEEERRRISRELHDDLNQRLAMLTVELETLEKDPMQSAELIRGQLKSLRTRTEGISDDVRRTAHQLHPSTVDHLGLPAALRSLCNDFSKQEKMRVDYRQRNINGSLAPDVALCLYRVTQEALRNVAKHSGARRATVSFMLTKDRILLSISDTGVGFDREITQYKKGLGIVSMEERVRLVVGTLTIRSRPGDGTRVVVEVPLPAPEETA